MRYVSLLLLLLCGCSREPRYTIVPLPTQSGHSASWDLDLDFRALLIDSATGETWCLRTAGTQWVPLERPTLRERKNQPATTNVSAEQFLNAK